MAEQLLTYKPVLTDCPENGPGKGLFIAVSHATRVPPHIGIVADKKYHSLSVKGQDLNVPVDAFLRNTSLRKIPSLFIKIKPHPTFSDTYLGEHFITNVQQFNRVDTGIATCLSPIKLFFEEVYAVSMSDVNYLFELLPLLDSKGLIENSSCLFVDKKNYSLPVYTLDEINEGILRVRSEFNN